MEGIAKTRKQEFLVANTDNVVISASQSFNLFNQLGISRGDGVAIFSARDLVLLDCNQVYLAFFQPPYNEKINIMGRKVRDIFPDQSFDLFNEMKTSVINTGKAFYLEEAELSHGALGQTYWNISLMPILENQEIKYFISYLSNETEKVLNRKASSQRNQELESIVENISDQTAHRIEQEELKLVEMQNQMFTTISHELKTPLNVILSAVQLTEMNLKGKTSKEIAMIKQNCYRFSKIINNIIDLSSMESGFYQLRYNKANIVEVVREIVESVESYLDHLGLEIHFKTHIKEKMMAVDKEKLERIILNLISNAVKFSSKGQAICVSIKEEDFILIDVRDWGQGIAKEHLEMIFDKYKKTDNTLIRNAEGSGIGLALVKTLVRRVSVESELGQGSVFMVRLPVKLEDHLETIDTYQPLDKKRGQLAIEFSDLYPK